MDIWESKTKIDAIFLNDQTINDKKKQNLVEKCGKNYWMKRINRHLAETQKQYQEEINKLNISYATQVEELNEIVSNLSFQLVSTEWLRQQHGEKFIQIVNGLKKKYKECKTSLKLSEAKVAKLEYEFNRVNSELTEVGCFNLIYR